MRKEIQISLSPEQYADVSYLRKAIVKASHIENKYLSYKIIKESLDCRGEPVYRLNVAVTSDNDLQQERPMPFLDVSNSMEVIVVGAGPCGLMAALKLIQKGLKPIIIERGSMVEQRKQDVAAICRNEDVNEDSNYCFGEGGAGTFSDGKLFTRSNKKGSVSEVLQLLVYFGAEENILYQSHAHIGTDVLSRVVKNIRQKIIQCGGQYLFNTKVENIIVKSNKVIGVTTSQGEDILASNVILATGHSARDIYQLFYDNSWAIQAKEFAIGVRVEHPQSLINSIQYHNSKYSKLLPAAEYSLVCNNGERGIYSFCMCPGGIVVPTPDRDGIMVVNGMSNSKRSGAFANSAIVVSVKQSDAEEFEQYGALKLMYWQEKWEQKMYLSKRIAPAQRLTDFMQSKLSSSLAKTSYKPGLQSEDMSLRLPKFVSENLKIGFATFEKKMPGFITNQANIIGLESRTSSTVRILRDKNTMQHIQLKNLYPCGEGAGYAGGITSSALDGINAANKIAEALGI